MLSCSHHLVRKILIYMTINKVSRFGSRSAIKFADIDAYFTIAEKGLAFTESVFLYRLNTQIQLCLVSHRLKDWADQLP